MVVTLKPIFHWKWGLRWLGFDKMNFRIESICWDFKQKNEMYMANARNLRLGPNATYIPLTVVGGWRRE